MSNILQQRNIEPAWPINQLTTQQQIALLPRPNNVTNETNQTATNSIINDGINENTNNILTPQATVGLVVTAGAANTTAQQPVLYSTAPNMHLIKGVINRKLFRSVKFVSSKDDLYFNTDEYSIAQIVLSNITIPADIVSQSNCWNQIQHIVPETLNRKRTSTTFAIKKKFNGTYTLLTYTNTHQH